MTARDEPCVEPAHDTWRPWTGAARWTWAPAAGPAGDGRDALNPWVADQVARLLDALGAIARMGRPKPDNEGPRRAVSKRNESNVTNSTLSDG